MNMSDPIADMLTIVKSRGNQNIRYRTSGTGTGETAAG